MKQVNQERTSISKKIVNFDKSVEIQEEFDVKNDQMVEIHKEFNCHKYRINDESKKRQKCQNFERI